jgi:hypothetical protein
MTLFEVIHSVIESEEYWDVVGVNPNNPNDTVLANRCCWQDRAETLAADLNRLHEIEPASEPHANREEKPRPGFLFDMGRKVRLED